MGTSRFLYTLVSKWLVVIGAVLVFGCQHKKPEESPGFVGPSTETAPSLGSSENIRSKKIGIVMGGAGVASLAAVGVFNAFQAENIKPAFVVSTGWPSIIALAYGYLNSLHDVEWLAGRLKPEFFFRAGMLKTQKGFQDHAELRKFLDGYFKQTDLRQTKVPIYIASQSLDSNDVHYASDGNWQDTLFGSIAAPGMQRPYSGRWVMLSQKGLDVDFAKSLDADLIIVVDMYSDYLQFLSQPQVDSSEDVFRKYFSFDFRKTLKQIADGNEGKITIRLSKPPTDFTQGRAAQRMGYEMTRRALRSKLGD